jgi:hypothetical protein
MKKRRLAKPKKVIDRPTRKPTLDEQYAELLRLREKVRRLAGSRINPQRLHQA